MSAQNKIFSDTRIKDMDRIDDTYCPLRDNNCVAQCAWYEENGLGCEIALLSEDVSKILGLMEDEGVTVNGAFVYKEEE